MNLDLQTIKKMAEKKLDLNSNQNYISIYLPLDNKNKDDAKLRLKSLISTHTKRKPNPLQKDDIYKKVISFINNKITTVKNLKQGLAVFLAIDHNDQQIKEETLKLFPIGTTIRKNIYVGKIYDLSQLIHSYHQRIKALIINIESDECQMYQLTDKRITDYEKIDNEFEVTREKEYLQQQTPNKFKKNIFGTGEKSVQKQNLKTNGLFLNKIQKKLKARHKNHFQFNYLIIYYSDDYTSIIEAFKSNLEEVLENTEIKAINKNLLHKEEIKQESLAKIRKASHNQRCQLIHSYLEGYNGVVSGWNKVCQAANQGNIKTLFLKNSVKNQGYLQPEQNLIYSYPKKNTHKINNLAPWLTRKAILIDSQVLILEDDDCYIKSDVAAHLRFEV